MICKLIVSGLFGVSLTQARATQEEEPQLRKCSHKTVLWASVQDIFLIDDGHGRAQPTGHGALSGQVTLSHIKKQVWESQGEQAGKQSFSMASASASDSRFLPWVDILIALQDGLWPGSGSQINPFFLSCVWPWCLSQQEKASWDTDWGLLVSYGAWSEELKPRLTLSIALGQAFTITKIPPTSDLWKGKVYFVSKSWRF